MREREREVWLWPMYWTEFCPSSYIWRVFCVFKQSQVQAKRTGGWLWVGLD